MEGLARHESLIQTLALLLAYLAVVLWERRQPLHPYDADDRWRITGNFGLLFINHAAPFFIVPMVTALSSWAASVMTVGWLNAVHAPRWMMFAMAVVALDLTGWVVHWAMHKVGPLWRVHRVHHSAQIADSMSNFGIVFSWWDRLAGTYRAPADQPPSAFGLGDVRDPRSLSLARLLIMPFRRLLR